MKHPDLCDHNLSPNPNINQTLSSSCANINLSKGLDNKSNDME